MDRIFNFQRSKTVVLLIDVQEKLFPFIAEGASLLQRMVLAIRGFSILGLPFMVTEQYPQGLGATLSELKAVLPPEQLYHEKLNFSCFSEDKMRNDDTQWILLGIEAHVCVLQTAKALIHSQSQVAVLQDAVGARSTIDCASALHEMREMGVRLTTIETVLFELLGSSQNAAFKEISTLIKQRPFN